MLQKAGIEVAFLSGRRSDAAYHRARELGVSRFHEGLRDKVAVMEEIMASMGIEAGAVAAVGDDLVDLPHLRRSGLAVAVADAVPEVKAAAHWVTNLPGGRGAVREVCDLLLKAQGKWEGVVRHWIDVGFEN
jgi:3-deoxy-D-manno-octulosonate 8-phosphate phosphatase (KDO 8-P phosphatase)